MIRWLAAPILAMLAITPAAAQPPIEVHHHLVVVSTTAVTVRTARVRSLLGLVNTSTAVIYCTADDTTATATPPSGIRLAAAGTTGDRHFFTDRVPFGAVSCIAATAGENVLLVTEGR